LQRAAELREPAGAVGIGERNALRHLAAAVGAVVVVAFDQRPVASGSQGGTQARFAATGHTHDNDRRFHSHSVTNGQGYPR
jgi:hypothetical protein